MKIAQFAHCGLLLAGSAALVGCQKADSTRVNKPVIESDAGDQIENEAAEFGEDVSEAASETADAVTPDDNIVDIDTPLGNVDVGEDPVTGDTNVNVDTDVAEVDVDDRNE